MGATLEQDLSNIWKPLAFFSRKFSPAQRQYSAYDRELTAIYEAIKNFSHFLEGRNFKILTNHKPLSYAFTQRSEKASPRQQTQISFISQFSTKIDYLPGKDNVVADSLSRIESICLATDISLIVLARAQEADEELRHLLSSLQCSLNLKKIQWGPEHTNVACDLSADTLRPYIQAPLRKRIFDLFHS